MGVLGFAKFSHCIFMRTPVLVANISESSAVIHASLALAPRYRSALANMWQYQPWPRSQTGTSLGSKNERAWRQMEVPKIWGSTKVGTKETQRALQVKRARGTRQRRYLQDMAQESDSSTPSSSSESGWKCRALATSQRNATMILLPLIPCDLEDITRYMTQKQIYVAGQLFTTFAHFWEKNTFWPATIYTPKIYIPK